MIDETKETGVLKEFHAVRKHAKKITALEKERVGKGLTPWGTYGESLHTYDDVFSAVLPEGIEKFIEARKTQTGKAFVMDAMGSGGFFAGLSFDGGVALALTQPPEEWVKSLTRKSPNVEFIDGDILSGSTWAKVNDYLSRNQEKTNSGFDLIACRPFGGWLMLEPGVQPGTTAHPPRNEIQKLIINNLYKVLRSNGGTLLIELAEEYDGSKFTNKEIQKWLQQLNEQGIETKNSWKIVRLTRTNQSPANLPIN